MQWEVVIGFETHVQLKTQSKIFSGSPIGFGAAPNTQASPVDLALPGVLPVMNKGAVEKAIQFGLAVGATIAPESIFARKNYFYPDLPKGYQISQFEIPVVQGGFVSCAFEKDGKAEVRVIELTRAHLEEDAGKSLHEDYQGMTGIDLNRAGTPLLEIVTEPVMRSAVEAVAYAKALHALVMWLDICDGNMQEGSFRCDANVSVRPFGQTEYGTRCEIKNLNSFRFLEEAINIEIHRQIELIEDGGRVVQETRLYDPDRKETRSMRSKEDSQDYRYFPDPDLPPLKVSAEWIEQVRSSMPELPDAMRARFIAQFGLSAYDAALMTQSKGMASYFEALVGAAGVSLAKAAANLMMGDVASTLKRENTEIGAIPLSPAQLALLLQRVADGTISNKIAKEVLAAMWEAPNSALQLADQIIDAKGLKQISDVGALEKIIDEVLAANPQSVEEYRAGKEKAFNSLVGQAMKATKGKGNPAQVNDLLKQKLSA
ncbi:MULTISPECIES: Asp-tRNA(Asn)/Glu-tRNA(Gln) amidotransferase subunit GatB [unclassified Undibacterium]|uniref:Asp-tRNA(Asn)/Glu-tRNA(Gln) amidotransferase subunit GatB n=1 Tax=unclassified Undibacterium TaxID=2630295 RepID=UPI002AC8DFA2|nr:MULTISPECIES: Asp-tRNA(Asn)/Glu-tRNA(Gln) amidotransferase subunit GatB [unclassified Undibacterium]MEB0139931.1 Asp-tRNA(Asn)/Glu-tRNA(Gln) amidotransferase subunit GatB [Undibacterium sp. CCC2.1]MEB0172904.1 Asp-tRNA(Asn)/Glu-tRNA(Gln) amidotransferase subunit GatB [Undibacterium sp. CCC1.1]MEB0176731.1 Asp-tRNA(Asn)/Glu-tRNA(Gln) amidotransferase subunit GatB [Undibacterium sp. CCC3.4]MEB0216658.1 Asp-tRNA(Asn)/Glu-tRNA(Gln) amidotransferase subunit GatB [Undibacterium sp. 5I2]WPX44970.1